MTQRIESAKILKTMFLEEGMTFKNDDGWNTLAEHVEVHNQYLNQKLKYNVSWDDALFSWYENIYTPLWRSVITRKMRSTFPTQTLGELYLALSDHWFYLKEKHENIASENAAYNFAYISKDRSSNFFTRLFHTPAIGQDMVPNRRKVA